MLKHSKFTGKYWNSTKRSDCPILDDSEGITLRSLGGVFICTLFGLLIAMVVLVIEVLNMKKAEKNKVQEITSAWKGIKCFSQFCYIEASASLLVIS